MILSCLTWKFWKGKIGEHLSDLSISIERLKAAIIGTLSSWLILDESQFLRFVGYIAF